MTNSQPAGLYMYTTDSSFNTIAMGNYMGNGKVIKPPLRQYGGISDGTYSSNTSSTSGNLSNVELFNPTNMNSTTAVLDIIEDSTS